ncbi:hypothetical protein IEQ34_001822 [Dendrobium chrysotoxum]|uniref:Uncharacterized protein n=1 Tax=Dendrobium chrysotoxum TaxID=161865 RepID=A0AAV7H8Z6_DENCH|nr:hypothetical protein IEQ34_001822 [Dendrobium chrysotoxum]
MGLLDKLWDDTLAGPQPDTGLGRLRKPAPLTFRSISGKDYGGDLPEEKLMVTRSIMIKKPAGYSSPTIGTPPASPAGTTPPVSPFSGSKEWNRFRRNSCDAYERGVRGGMAKSPSSSYEV